jgi:hypothetical protein
MRKFQKKLHANKFYNLDNYIDRRCRKEGRTLKGRPVILFSSYAGSPRHQAQAFLDSMQIAKVKGAPTYFLTVTANPHWLEIEENLETLGPYAYTVRPAPPREHNQHADERCDLIDRVCMLKFKAIVDEIVKEEIFGPHIAYVGVVEFQKRGLPHMHLLITSLSYFFFLPPSYLA